MQGLSLTKRQSDDLTSACGSPSRSCCCCENTHNTSSDPVVDLGRKDRQISDAHKIWRAIVTLRERAQACATQESFDVEVLCFLGWNATAGKADPTMVQQQQRR